MKPSDISKLDPKQYIIIKGARMHNLKNVDVALPRNKMIVITGLSGSGKSSLAFDTLYAEGQRRYVESLSAYARQFLGKLEKPLVDYIKGISPAIAIEQKVISTNPRSTVGTTTEIYDYLKLLFARIGKTFSPVSGHQVKRHNVSDVVDFLLNQKDGSIALILSKLITPDKRKIETHLELLKQQGFSRLLVNNEIFKIEDFIKQTKTRANEIYLLIDRLILSKGDDDLSNRIADSVQTAFYEGNGECLVYFPESQSFTPFSNRFELDGMSFSEPDVNFFTFNNPVGACKLCEGFGSIIGIDPDLVIPNKSLSIYENAVACWNGEAMSKWKNQLIKNAHKFDFPVHTPIFELTEKEYETLWEGNKFFDGIMGFFRFVEGESYKIQYRVMLARYRGKTTCPDCKGTRLRKDASYVKISGLTLSELVLKPIHEVYEFFKELNLSDYDKHVAKRLLIEITTRLNYLCNVGLSYLTLNRVANTLSGGESQRINLAKSLGSSLVGSMYILDEPSIGLHPRDTERLIGVLRSLQKLGNTVIIVEHDEDIMRESDQLIDIGPQAGSQGGELVFQGSLEELKNESKSLTAQYLNGNKSIAIPYNRRKWNHSIEVRNLKENNLKNISVRFPLNVFCAITGVSGSGKSTLIKKGLLPYLRRYLDGHYEKISHEHLIGGDLKQLKGVEYVDQNPIGKSSRSNPVTYVKAYDEIRNLFAEQSLARSRNYKPSHFSFNVDGGRCEVCEGEGKIMVQMQFMADIQLTCESCKGKRFKEEILEVKFKGVNISELLQMTIDDAIVFFSEAKENKTCKKINDKLIPLQQVGMGYVQMGQSSSTLSGGEAQRIKLASFLIGGQTSGSTLFVFDEPTTGLHFHDIHKLLLSFNALLDKGHSIIVIEHNLEMIKCADWIIDIGPEGGDNGGYVLFEGKPEDLINVKNSFTANYLKNKLEDLPLLK